MLIYSVLYVTKLQTHMETESQMLANHLTNQDALDGNFKLSLPSSTNPAWEKHRWYVQTAPSVFQPLVSVLAERTADNDSMWLSSVDWSPVQPTVFPYTLSTGSFSIEMRCLPRGTTWIFKYNPAYCGGPGSIPRQSTWKLSWSQRHRNMFFSPNTCFPLSVKFHKRSILVFI